MMRAGFSRPSVRLVKPDLLPQLAQGLRFAGAGPRLLQRG